MNHKFDCGCVFDVVKDDSGEIVSVKWDPLNVRLDCQKTWEMIGRGATGGIFQLESYLGKTYSKKLKPANISEWSDLVAIIRPGCLDAITDGKSATEHYIDRKNKKEEPQYEHPIMEQILGSTQGINVYQEQSMKLAQQVAGYNGPESYSLIKAIGKKKPELMAKHKEKFIEGCIKRGISEEDAKKIFDNIESSQRYSFNHSHAIAYSLDGYYYSAFIKAHFPRVFYATQLDFSPLTKREDNDIAVCDVIEDAMSYGIRFMPPDIRYKNKRAIIDDGYIVPGLSRLKFINESVIDSLPEQKVTWDEFLLGYLINIPIRAAESMIYSGATSCFNVYRKQQFFELKEIAHNLSDSQVKFIKDNNLPLKRGIEEILKLPTGKGQLCYNKTSVAKIATLLKKMEKPPYSLIDNNADIARWEREYIGRELTQVDIDDNIEYQSIDATLVANPSGLDTRKDYLFCGVIRSFRIFTSKAGNVVVFINAYDLNGGANNIGMNEETYNKYSQYILKENSVCFKGKFSKNAFWISEVRNA